jgi:hypothetical protein
MQSGTPYGEHFFYAVDKLGSRELACRVYIVEYLRFTILKHKDNRRITAANVIEKLIAVGAEAEQAETAWQDLCREGIITGSYLRGSFNLRNDFLDRNSSWGDNPMLSPQIRGDMGMKECKNAGMQECGEDEFNVAWQRILSLREALVLNHAPDEAWNPLTETQREQFTKELDALEGRFA